MSSQQSIPQTPSSQLVKTKSFLDLTDETRFRIYKLLLGGKTFDMTLSDPNGIHVKGDLVKPETRPLKCLVLGAEPDSAKKGRKKKGEKSRTIGGHQVNILRTNKQIHREGLQVLYGGNNFSIRAMNYFDAFTRRPTDTGPGNAINGYDNVGRPGIEYVRHIELRSAGRTPFDGALSRLSVAQGIRSLKIHVSKSDAQYWPGWLFDGLVDFLDRIPPCRRAEVLDGMEFVANGIWYGVPGDEDTNRKKKNAVKFDYEEANQFIRGRLASYFGIALE